MIAPFGGKTLGQPMCPIGEIEPFFSEGEQVTFIGGACGAACWFDLTVALFR